MGTIPSSHPGQVGMVPTHCPPQYPSWILHDVNHGSELFLPSLTAPPCAHPVPARPGAGQWGEAGRQPARCSEKHRLQWTHFFSSLLSPFPTRPGWAASCPPPPSLAILGVARGCGCFLWLCVFVVRVLKREIETASGGGRGSGGVYPQSRSAPLATKSPLLPASAVN